MKSKLVALAVSLLLVVGCQDEKQKLYVYTCADYIDPELIEKFEDKVYDLWIKTSLSLSRITGIKTSNILQMLLS